MTRETSDVARQAESSVDPSGRPRYRWYMSKPGMTDSEWVEWVVRLGFLLLIALAVFASLQCTPAQLGQVQNASDKRRIICDFVQAWEPNHPELAKPLQLCKAGADLQAIAAAYAGCSEPE